MPRQGTATKRLVCWWKGHRWDWWMVGRCHVGEPFCSRCFANWDEAQRSAIRETGEIR